MEVYAICDIGSNTVKVHFFKTNGNSFERVDSLTYPAKLISYIDGGIMKRDGVELLCRLINEYRSEADKRNCRFYAFATASLRRASNADDIIKTVRERTGVFIELVSGEKEAALCTAGVINEIGKDKCGIHMDMGGGSTEIIEIDNGIIKSAGSMPFGSLSLFRDNVSTDLPDDKEAAKIEAYVKKCYTGRGTPKNEKLFIGGGTGKAILKLMGAGKGLCTVDSERFFDLREKITSGDVTFEDISECVPDRATTLTPGLIAICEILRLSGAESATFVTAGAREGYLLSII